MLLSKATCIAFKLVLHFYQLVAMNDEVSYRSQVQYGVPQGSVLGPLLLHALHVTLGKYHHENTVSFTVMLMILNFIFLCCLTNIPICKTTECIVDYKKKKLDD